MSLPKNMLDRVYQNEIGALPTDSFGLLEWRGSTMLLLSNGEGGDLLKIANLTEAQLEGLFTQIGQRLNMAPGVRMDHIRQLHGILGDILNRDEAERGRREEDEMGRLLFNR